MNTNVDFWRFSLQYYKKAIPYSICKCFPFITNIISFYLISLYKDETLTTGFGLAISFYNLMNCVLTNVNSDTAGMLTTKYYGMDSLRSLSLTYYNGLFTNSIIFLFSIIYYIRLDLILVSFGFDEKSSEVALKSIYSMFPF